MAKVHKSVGNGKGFILAVLAHCNDDDNDDENLRIEHSKKSLRDPSSLRSVGMTLGRRKEFHTPKFQYTSQKIQYFPVSTPVLSRKYSSTWT